MYELDPTNAFGELLLDLIEAQYGDIDTGLMALMQTTGLSEAEVVGVINGEAIVEDESLLNAMIQAFPDADAEDVSVIIDVAIGVEEADGADLQAQVQDAQNIEQQMLAQQAQNQGGYPASAEGGYAGGEAGGAEGGFSRGGKTANFAHNLVSALEAQQAQINQLTNGISNFQAATALNQRLKDIDTVASQYVASEMLPPSYKAMLVGNFRNDNERLAKFSQVAQENGVDVQTLLFATEYALGMLGEASQFVEFSDFSLSDEDVAIAEFSANLDKVVEQDYSAIFGE